MEQRITRTNLKSNIGKKILVFVKFALSAAGSQTISSVIGMGGIVIPSLSLILSLIIGAIQRDYNPVKQTISQLVYYRYGWLQATDFLILGVWLILLALRFYSNFTQRLTTKIAVLLFAIFGIGFFLIAIFPTNFPGHAISLQSAIHDKTAQLICALFPIACCLMIPEFNVNRRLNKMANFTLMTVIIGFTLGILGATVSVTNMPLLGIIERLIFLNAVIWSIVMGINLIILKTGKTAGEER